MMSMDKPLLHSLLIGTMCKDSCIPEPTLMFSTVRLSGLTDSGISWSQLHAVLCSVLIHAGWASEDDAVRRFFSVS